jgi:hypothetical protein
VPITSSIAFKMALLNPSASRQLRLKFVQAPSATQSSEVKTRSYVSENRECFWVVGGSVLGWMLVVDCIAERGPEFALGRNQGLHPRL